MPIRKSSAKWTGNLKEGKGTVNVGENTYSGPYTFASRFETGEGTNPEELIGAAHAGCFSMALSHGLDQAGFTPESVSTTAQVSLEDGSINEITLVTEANVPGIDEETFQQQAQDAKENCPVSKVLAATSIKLEATLAQS